jgi:hypothetical protein
VALRVVPLVPVAPWWTLWLIGIAAVFGVAARFIPRGRRLWRKAASSALALGALLPGVVLGWQSTVVEVTWWAIGLGLIAAITAALGPYRVPELSTARATRTSGAAANTVGPG